MLSIDGAEQLAKIADRFRAAEEKEPVRPQGVVEDRDHFALQRRAEVDHHVAATDEIELREGRIFRHVLRGEYATVANGFTDAIPPVDSSEESSQPLRRHLGGNALGIQSDPRALDGHVAHIGGEDLNRA